MTVKMRLWVLDNKKKKKDCPPPLPHTPPVQQQHQLILAPQATLRPTGGVPGKVGLHLTTYVCFVFFSLCYPKIFNRICGYQW